MPLFWLIRRICLIRKAIKKDIDRILEVYDSAKKFMHSHGNPTQWNGSYPERSLLESDVEKGNLFAMYDENDRIYGVFALIGGDDPTYSYIEGKWQSDTYYGTIHRIAGDGSKNGILRECCEFARKNYNHLRVDTHEDNKPMQKSIANNGFAYSGIIYLENGDERLAYQKI